MEFPHSGAGNASDVVVTESQNEFELVISTATEEIYVVCRQDARILMPTVPLFGGYG